MFTVLALSNMWA